MGASWNGSLLLEVLSSGGDVDAVARRLVDEGVDATTLADLEELVRALAWDPSAQDRALLLVERTRLLAERAGDDARTSRRLRTEADRARTSGHLRAVGPGALWRHELATPLAVVDLALETLPHLHDDPTRMERTLEVARRNVRYAIHLLDGLSSLEDLRTGRIELTWEQVDVGALVREITDDARGVVAGQREVELAVDGVVEVPADREAIRQVVLNLLTNAVKFSPSDSRIDLVVSATATHAEVAVRDRGRGLSPRDADRVFDAGERLDAGAPGIGLGLFVARQLARAHGGELDVEQPDDGGARFVLRLPRSPAEWQRSLERRERTGSARDLRQRRRGEMADARDAALDAREHVADERDAVLDAREHAADERDRPEDT